MKRTNVLLLIAMITVAMAAISSASSLIEFGSSTSDGNELDTVTYELKVNHAAENVTSIIIYLFDSDYNMVTNIESNYLNYTKGEFNNLADGKYFIMGYAQLESNENDTTEVKEIKVTNDLKIIYEDPTPLNDATFNMFNIPARVVVKSNKLSANITIIVLDVNDTIVKEIKGVGKLDKKIDLDDGEYKFISKAKLGDNEISTEERKISIHSTPPQVSNITLSIPIPESMNLGADTPIKINLSISEYPVFSLVIYAKSNSSSIRQNLVYLSLNSEENLPVSLNLNKITKEGHYTIFLAVRDNYGNINESSIGTIDVNTPPSNPASSGRRGGSSGSSSSAITLGNNITNVTLQNITNSTLFNSTGISKQPLNETKPSSFSGITGAFTAVLGKPTSFGAVLIIALLIVYLVYKGFQLNKDEEPKKKKKKKGKEEKEPTDEE